MTAATAIALNHFDRPALQRKSLKNFVRIKADRLRAANAHSSIAPSLRENHATKEQTMSSNKTTKNLAKLISDALWRRINAGALTRSHLRHALGCSMGTVNNLLNGHNDPSARVLMGLLSFMDTAFANEILAPTGCRVAKICEKRAEVYERYLTVVNELRLLEGA